MYGKSLMVDLREFYDKDGALAPGKKGISLPEDQWRKLQEVILIYPLTLPNPSIQTNPSIRRRASACPRTSGASCKR